MFKKSGFLSLVLVGSGLLAQFAFAGVPGFGPDPIVDSGAVIAQLVKSKDAATQSMQLLNESDLSCSSADQCTTVATGSKACGGPSGYLVVSLNNRFVVDGTIEKLAQQTAAIDANLNLFLGLVSDCSFLVPLDPVCLANTCQNVF